MTTAEERFWAKVQRDASGGCWLWTAGLSDTGYGQFWTGGKCQSAHRFSYETFVGPIPDGLHIDHLCRVRACVNPTHLEPVPPGVNNARGFSPSALNAQKTHCPQGHAYAGENLVVIRGKRHCRECKRRQVAEWRARTGPVQLTPEQRARKTEMDRRRSRRLAGKEDAA